ncbi:MAG: hypothetical protein Q9227_002045 [Pyrenula ochraceoflavens]
MFHLGPQHEAAMTFQLKTVYYKYLAAYEIAEHWHEDPPPREILEDISAKGGELRKRSKENFQAPLPRDIPPQPNNRSSPDEIEENSVTKIEAVDGEDKVNADPNKRYPTRTRAPEPKPQPEPPDTPPRRSTRPSNTRSPKPPDIPSAAPVADSRGQTINMDDYRRPQMPLTVKPVNTPKSNPEMFTTKQNMIAARRAQILAGALPQRILAGNLPDKAMHGPNIYIRCLMGLRSGIPAEVDFALHHLVKISYERGDKFRFEGFPQLCEALLYKALEITKLLYGREWEVNYQQDGTHLTDLFVLEGCYGTPDLLDRLKYVYDERRFQSQYTLDLEDGEFRDRLAKVNEAALVLRNMVILPDNAKFAAGLPLVRDFLVIALQMPDQPAATEFKNYALEICEEVTRYLDLRPDQALYQTLLPYLKSTDRAKIIRSLRAINRIALTLDHSVPMVTVPVGTVEHISAFTLDNDDIELLALTLDFIYQYTAIPENVAEFLTRAKPLYPRALVTRLMGLLLHDAKPVEKKVEVAPEVKREPCTEIAKIPDDLRTQMNCFSEPARSSYWLRSCFEESPGTEITQIQIWQAYHTMFQNDKYLPASEFIKNVSATFAGARAEVTIEGGQNKFIITGIRPKRMLTNLSQRPYKQCLWHLDQVDSDNNPTTKPCGAWILEREDLWKHILNTHLVLPKNSDGPGFKNVTSTPEEPVSYKCRFDGCTRAPFTASRHIADHVRLHIPADPTPLTASSSRDPEVLKPAAFRSDVKYLVDLDERNYLTGIPLQSILILCNIARSINRLYEANPNGVNKWQAKMHELFISKKTRLWEIFYECPSLSSAIYDLFCLTDRHEALLQPVESLKDGY